MAANDPIGRVTEMRLISKDENQENVETKIWGSMNSSATYGQVDTFSRALNALTTNTYYDTILTTQTSVMEQVVDD